MTEDFGHAVRSAAFTLNKASGRFSPTTQYRNYAISSGLIHCESQGVVRAKIDSGLQSRNHIAKGSSIMLFAREHSDDRAFWFLGLAASVLFEGEKPMAVTSRLRRALPGDLFASFSTAVREEVPDERP